MEWLKIVFRLLIWRSIYAVDAIIRPGNTLSIRHGQGFVAYLEVANDFGETKNCFYKFQDDDDKVRIELSDNKFFKSARNESIFPFGKDLCGIKVSNVSSSSSGTWTLEAESINGSFENDSISIIILPPQKINFDTRVQLEVGKSLVRCSTHQHHMQHCKIIDISNDATYNQCELETTVYPHSMFECFTYDAGNMEHATHERIFVDIKNSSFYTNSSLTNLKNATILACEFQYKIVSCQAEMPNNKSELLLMDGLYNGHYSAYKTITSQSKCNLEIPKPHRESDIGLWRIINYDALHPSGCLFYVGKNKEDIILGELRKENKTEKIKVYEPDTDEDKIENIFCTVPFRIYDCYLKSPNNTIYFPEKENFEWQRLLGKCAFNNVPVIAGTWKCGCRGRDHDKEVVQNIEVDVKSKFGEILTDLVKAKSTDTVELMCKSSFEEPISHCAFIDPQGNVHLVGTRNSIKSKGRVQYYGRGINKGECGIKIASVTQDDFGQWKCQFTFYLDGRKSSFMMDLQQSDSAHVTSVGLGIGLTVIFILVMGVVIGTIFYRRRNSTACHNFVSSSPLEPPTSSTTSI